jgi:hypothetical protein
MFNNFSHATFINEAWEYHKSMVNNNILHQNIREVYSKIDWKTNSVIITDEYLYTNKYLYKKNIKEGLIVEMFDGKILYSNNSNMNPDFFNIDNVKQVKIDNRKSISSNNRWNIYDQVLKISKNRDISTYEYLQKNSNIKFDKKEWNRVIYKIINNSNVTEIQFDIRDYQIKLISSYTYKNNIKTNILNKYITTIYLGSETELDLFDENKYNLKPTKILYM